MRFNFTSPENLYKVDQATIASIDHTLRLPVDLNEAILFLLYICGKADRIHLMKLLDISYLKFRIPLKFNISVWHYGPSDRYFHKYLRIRIEEGYVNKIKDNGKEYYQLSETGRNYVKEQILPWDCLDPYSEKIMYLLSLPLDILINYSEFLSGFKGERGNRTYIRLASVEDFTSLRYDKIPAKICLNTLIFAYHEVRRFYGGPMNKPSSEKMQFVPVVPVENLHQVLIKQNPPKIRTDLYELKNYVFNRFLYVISVYLINVVENSWAPIEMIKSMTHDHFLHARRELMYSKYLKDDEKERLMKQKKDSNHNIKRDLDILVKNNFLEEKGSNHRALSYKVKGVSFTDKNVSVYLPDSEYIKEMHHLIHDEKILLDSRLNSEVRGYASSL